MPMSISFVFGAGIIYNIVSLFFTNQIFFITSVIGSLNNGVCISYLDLAKNFLQ